MNENKKPNYMLYVVIVLLLIIIGLLAMNMFKNNNGGGNVTPGTQEGPKMDDTQGEYKVPEMANFVSKNITLPGWGSFTIPKNTTDINKGFEFHNPDANHWNEVDISYKDNILENLIVENEMQTSIEHYAKLAGIEGTTYDVKSYDSEYFEVNEVDGAKYLKALKPFEGTKEIVITVDDKEYTLKANSRENVYYMTFSLYLQDNDELLYESGLVAPGNYIQTMKMSRALSEGSYDAYVLIQPYKSDKVTSTNNGKVVIKLNVK